MIIGSDHILQIKHLKREKGHCLGNKDQLKFAYGLSACFTLIQIKRLKNKDKRFKLRVSAPVFCSVFPTQHCLFNRVFMCFTMSIYVLFCIFYLQKLHYDKQISGWVSLEGFHSLKTSTYNHALYVLKHAQLAYNTKLSAFNEQVITCVASIFLLFRILKDVERENAVC